MNKKNIIKQNGTKIANNIKNIELDETQFNNYKRTGIINEGSTCYMNSIIQIIYNIPIFVKYICEIENNDTKNKYYEFIIQLKKILVKLNTSNKTISIKELFNCLEFENGNWNSSQDAHEYYNKILDILKSFNKNIENIAYGMMIGKVEVKQKNYISKKNEKFLFLELEINDNHNLADCLNSFFKKEILKDDNKIEIEENGQKYYYEGTKQFRIQKIPDILHIALKRFKYNYQKRYFFKINNKIQFLENYDFSIFLDTNQTLEGVNKRYILFSLLIHSGTVNNGHYFVIIKDFRTNRYFKLNDTEVSNVSKNIVLNDYCGGYYYHKDFDFKYKYEKETNVYILIYINAGKIKYFFDYRNINKIFYLKSDYALHINKNTIPKKKSTINFHKELNKNNKVSQSNLGSFQNLKNNKESINEVKSDISEKKTNSSYKNNNDLNIINKKYINEDKVEIPITLDEKQNYSLINNHKNSKYAAYQMKKISIPSNIEELCKCQKKFPLLIEEDIDYNTLINININHNKDLSPIYKSWFQLNNKEDSNSNPTKFPSLIWVNHTYTNFLFFLNYRLKYQESLLFKYNNNLFVKDLPFIIFTQLCEFGSKIKKNVIARIINNNQYLILLLNSFGLVISIFQNPEEEIYNLLKPSINYVTSELIVKHVCIYYISYLNKIKRIENIITINIVSNDKLHKITDKNNRDIEEYINPPILFLNYKFFKYEKFVHFIKKVFYKNMEITDINKYNLEIYVINEPDILNVNISQLHLLKLNFYTFFIKIMHLNQQCEKIEFKRIIISFKLK